MDQWTVRPSALHDGNSPPTPLLIFVTGTEALSGLLIRTFGTVPPVSGMVTTKNSLFIIARAWSPRGARTSRSAFQVGITDGSRDVAVSLLKSFGITRSEVFEISLPPTPTQIGTRAVARRCVFRSVLSQRTESRAVVPGTKAGVPGCPRGGMRSEERR